jgi:ferrous iron transport protein A
MTTTTLAALDIGEGATVVDVDAGGAMAIRLLEMGFVPGTWVKLLKAAPLGDPLQLQLRGYHISLRRAEAAKVRVKRS